MRARAAVLAVAGGLLLLSAGGPAATGGASTGLATRASAAASSPREIPLSVPTPIPVPGSQPTLLDATRSNPLHQPVPPQGHWVIRDQSTVVKLYDYMMAMPPFPMSGTINCPAMFGVTYRLVFLRGSQTILAATVDPSGCEGVHLSNGKTLWAIPSPSTGPAFFSLLASTLKLSEPQLAGVPSLPDVVLPTTASARKR